MKDAGFYYIDTSVLLENIHTKLDPGPEWRIFHVLTGEDIDDVMSRFFTVLHANSKFVYNKMKTIEIKEKL